MRTCPACRRRCTSADWTAWSWASSVLGVNLLSLIATLREEGRLPIRSVQWFWTPASVAPQRGGHRERHSPAAQRAHQRWPRILAASAPAQWSTRRNRLARGRRQWLRVDFQHPHRTALLQSGQGGGRCAGRVVLRGWSAYAAYHRRPRSAAGPTSCGTSRPAHPLPQRRRTGPMGPAVQLYVGQSLQPSRPGKGCCPTGLGSCWPSAALSCLTRRRSRASCADASSATSRNSSSTVPTTPIACPLLSSGSKQGTEAR